MVSVTPVDSAVLLAELETLSPVLRLAWLRSVGDPESLLIALCAEADRLAATEVARALSVSELMVALANELDVPRVQAEALGARAMALAYAGRLDESLAGSELAFALADSAGLAVEAARSRLASVHALSRLGRYDEALAAGEAARDRLAALGEWSLAARADVSLGAVHDMCERPGEALRHYDRALAAIGDDTLVVAQVETNRGIALMGLDDFARAEEAFERAVTAFVEGGLDWAAAVAEGNLAYLATRQGRLERALYHFERARRCLEADEAPGDLARLLAEQADALATLGMPGEALESYEAVLPKLELHGLALEAAQARAGIGRAQLGLGQWDDAAASLAMAATQLMALGQQDARARLDLVRAELATQMHRSHEARILALDALDTLASFPADVMVAHELLARLDLQANDLAAAEAHLAVALPIAERLDVAPLQARLLHLRGMVAMHRGDSTAALSDLRTAVQQIERVRGALQAERFRSAFQGRHLAIYEDAVLAAVAGEELDEAFAMVERAKSRALLDIVGGALDLAEAASRKVANPAEAALLADLARLRAELNWHYSRPEKAGIAGSAAGAAERQGTAIRRLEKELDALQDRLAAASGLAGLMAPSVGVAAAMRALPAGTALIEFFVAGDELLAFVLFDGRITLHRRLATSGELAERVRGLHFQIGRAVAGIGRGVEGARAARMLADARRELGELYEVLVAPLAEALVPAERLLIVPHGVLHMLPFAALWDGERYLIESHEIVTAPSASVYAQLAANATAHAAEEAALVAGVPDALAPWIAVEAREVAELLDTHPLLDAEVTAAAFAREAEGAALVHLACHGRFVPDRPRASGLKLADRWLTVRDVYALRLRAALVTLSGCETGRTAIAEGDELLGLMRGFFVAGARSLLISLWVTNDESTTALMTEFYRRYRQGDGAGAALQGAQRSLLASRPHPAFWAPFILGGHP